MNDSAIIISILGGVFFTCLLLWLAGSSEELMFAKKCKHCGKKDKNWRVLPVGHDNFAWHHQCDASKQA